eukprot:TRINITY_DN474_c0_g1_i1.p1 TRINITY_DN474_c0_g1~~TRINITY_DN474_c0_g1_i1.p1  ORF type:complete len:157 (-),score=36.54 TRINITY_DN474_c0_g1_i1:583-1053(-)
MEFEDFRNLGDYDTFVFRTASAAGSSFCAGTLLGAIAATWQDVPVVERNQSLPALKRTAKVMGSYGATFAAIGGVFAATDCLAERLRGKKDLLNGVIGGMAAGAVIGLRAGSLPYGLGASAAFAAMSAIVDAGGHVVRTPTERSFLPYSAETENKV